MEVLVLIFKETKMANFRTEFLSQIASNSKKFREMTENANAILKREDSQNITSNLSDDLSDTSSLENNFINDLSNIAKTASTLLDKASGFVNEYQDLDYANSIIANDFRNTTLEGILDLEFSFVDAVSSIIEFINTLDTSSAQNSSVGPTYKNAVVAVANIVSESGGYVGADKSDINATLEFLGQINTLLGNQSSAGIEFRKPVLAFARASR